MLKNVHLSNLALIKEADIDFAPGLNILTGETGAGKSIIIGSINIALGEKASRSFIRTGAMQGLVELQFSTEDPRILQLMESMEIPLEDGLIVISRRITPDGSTSRINGVTVTLNRLRSITSLLVDIHGQHDHQSLLQSSKHLEIIDEYGKETIDPIKMQFREHFQNYRSLRNELRQFSQDPEQLVRDMALAEFECQEIEDAQLKIGEDNHLEEACQKMGHAREITSGLSKIRARVFDDIDSAVARISEALRDCNHLETLDPDLHSFTGILMDLESIARDMDHDLSRYVEDHSFDARRYEELRARLDQINHLKSKYGSSLEAISDYHDRTAEKLKKLQQYAAGKEQISVQMQEIKAKVRVLADQLSKARKAAAAELEQQILRNLQDLNFQDVQFEISFERADKISNLCEIKYTNKPFEIDAAYEEQLVRKRDIFKSKTGTSQSLKIVMISAKGLRGTAHTSYISDTITLDDLFEG